MFYLTRIPLLIQRLYRHWTWSYRTTEKVLYLTFDDGPTPEVTDFVLTQLKSYQAKATFFLIGQQVEAHPEIAKQIVSAGHTIGNHTQTHVRGRKTSAAAYLQEISDAQVSIEVHTGVKPRLFRPPYGSLTRRQSRMIRPRFEIAMMDVVPGDFDDRKTADQCAQAVIRHARPGSIVVFHDSEKARPRLEKALPQVLAHFHEAGYRFAAMEPVTSDT